ncbi:MAG: hypothetical protein MJK13_04455 [Pseudomonadales bacterium]|nr:hypothetical protein [Pseudomonadales bacterium]
MSSENWIKLIALVELVAAIPWKGVYLFGWYYRNVTEFSTWMIGFSIEGGLFIMAPIISIIGAFMRKKWATYTLMIFPVLAFIHGISAIPYLSHIAPNGPWRTLALVIINGGLLYFIHRHREGNVPRHT